MTKIVEAANAMIANPDKITNVIQAGDEVFFLYKDKYKWSSIESSDDYRLYFYPGGESIERLVDSALSGWDTSIPMISYSSEDIGSNEAIATFKELYTLVKGKAFGIDDALDDIISDLF